MVPEPRLHAREQPGLAVWILLDLRRELAEPLQRMVWAANAAYVFLARGGLVLDILNAT